MYVLHMVSIFSDHYFYLHYISCSTFKPIFKPLFEERSTIFTLSQLLIHWNGEGVKFHVRFAKMMIQITRVDDEVNWGSRVSHWYIVYSIYAMRLDKLAHALKHFQPTGISKTWHNRFYTFIVALTFFLYSSNTDKWLQLKCTGCCFSCRKCCCGFKNIIGYVKVIYKNHTIPVYCRAMHASMMCQPLCSTLWEVLEKKYSLCACKKGWKLWQDKRWRHIRTSVMVW